MVKVLLTTDRCNPPLTRVIDCDEVHYAENRHTISMYAQRHGKKRALIAWTFIDEWQNIVIEHENGIKQVIK